jgi:hypothetical protein
MLGELVVHVVELWCSPGLSDCDKLGWQTPDERGLSGGCAFLRLGLCASRVHGRLGDPSKLDCDRLDRRWMGGAFRRRGCAFFSTALCASRRTDGLATHQTRPVHNATSRVLGGRLE